MIIYLAVYAISLSLSIYKHIYIHMYVCMYACMYIYIYGHAVCALVVSIRKLTIRGSEVPHPDTYNYVSNHSNSNILIRKCMHARIQSPRVWKNI